MNIRRLLITQTLIFVVLLVICLGATLRLASGDGGDALYINIAGRQRMLSQKASKEALEFARDSSTVNRERLQSTIQLFSVSHRALQLGGTTPLGLSGGKTVSVTGASDTALLEQLDTVGQHWKTMVGAVDRLLAAAEKRKEALDLLSDKNGRLLANMDQAVRYFTAESNVSPNVVNVAGRQRMLSQRTALQALLIDSDPSPTKRSGLDASIGLFQTSHKGLRMGGRVPLRIDGTRTVKLPSAPAGRVADKLDEVEDLWKAQLLALRTLSSEETGFHSALADIQKTNPVVLSNMNKAVLMAQHVTEARLGQLKNLQLGALVFGLIAALLAGLLAVSIGRSLDTLRTAADAISTGRINQTIEPVGIGEVRALSQSFERMRFSLKTTMEMLERDERQGV